MARAERKFIEKNKAANIRSLRILPASAGLLLALSSLFFPACQSDRQSYVPNIGDGEETPTMATADVETFISDSGYTRYYVSTPLWLMFEDSRNPYWSFPEGVELEQYDAMQRPESNVKCDSAIYFSRKRLWRLDGNVVMVNTERDSFLTQQLFWNQDEQKIYSDSFIHIVRTDRIIEGYGFESDQNMRSYSVNNPTAIIPVDNRLGRKNKEKADSGEVKDTVVVKVKPVRDSQKVKKKPLKQMHSGLKIADSNQKAL